MKLQSSLLSAAILGVLALSSAASAATGTDAVTRARNLISAGSAPAVQRAAADTFYAKDSQTDANGTEHVRFQRLYRGLPVLGGDFVLHSRNGSVQHVTGSLDTTYRPSVTPKLSRDAAIVEAGTRFGTGFRAVPATRLVILAIGRQTPTLAWEVTFEGMRPDQTPTEMHYFVDANTGGVLRSWDAVMTATPGPGDSGCLGAVAAAGTGNSLAGGSVALGTSSCNGKFQMRDLGRGGAWTSNMLNRNTGNGSIFIDADNTWGSGTLNNMTTVGVDAHYGVATTWDYYKVRQGRMGIADDGVGALSRVHYGRNYANAFWRDSCFCMTFGDGDNGVTINPLTTLDIAGHEMSHGVTSRTAGLIYDDESGGLNEATSDIFGTMVEFHAQNPVDKPDWLVGEGVYVGNDGTMALRYMFKPSLDERSYDCYDAEMGEDDVHFTSGVANHFFYLLSQGAVVPKGFGPGTDANLTAADLVCDGNTALQPIGKVKAARIWYTALTTYMVEDTDYAGAREATLMAAADLYGGDSPEWYAVDATWEAVNVNAPIEE